MDLNKVNQLLSPFVYILLAHLYTIKSSESSFFITDDSSRNLKQQPFWNYIGTRSKVPCAPLSISKCKDINNRDNKPKGIYQHNRAQLVQNSLWREAQLHVRLPLGYEDPDSYFLRPVYIYNQIDRYGDLDTSNSNRIETVYRPRKQKKNFNEQKRNFMSEEETLDDLILENVLKQILNSSYHRKRLQSRPHLQRPQVDQHVMNKVRIPPQFPHYELDKLKSSNAILNSVQLYQNEYGYQVKSHTSKLGYGNGIEFAKPNRYNQQDRNKVFSRNPSSRPSWNFDNSEDDSSDDSTLNYITRKLIEIGLKEVNNEVFDGKRKDQKLANTLTNAIRDDIPSIASPDLSKIQHLISKYDIQNNLAKATIQPNIQSKYNLKLVPKHEYAMQKTPNKLNHETFSNNNNRIIYPKPSNANPLGTNDQEEFEETESSLLNRITTEGLKFALSKINNLVFDGKKEDEKLAETISTTIIHGIPNLLLPTFPTIPNIFQNAFGKSEKIDETNKTIDLKTSDSNIVPTELAPNDSDNNFRYVFLLGVVPAIVGSFLAIGAQPLQAMLVGAYVVTTYLFFVEKSWSQQKLQRSDDTNQTDDIESIFSSAINKFLEITKSQTFLEKYIHGSENENKNSKKTSINDLLIHKYFSYSDQLKPLLDMMDDQTIMYLRVFDDIMYDLVTSLQ